MISTVSQLFIDIIYCNQWDMLIGYTTIYITIYGYGYAAGYNMRQGLDHAMQGSSNVFVLQSFF